MCKEFILLLLVILLVSAQHFPVQELNEDKLAMPSQNFNLTFSLLLCPTIKVQGRSNTKQFEFLK